MTVDDPEYMTVTEVAEIARVSKMTVYRWIDSGILPGRKLGNRIYRIRSADVRALLGQ
jgi:excisionase family DNA binding protein